MMADGIKVLLGGFASTFFRHVKHVFNEAAHRLAKSTSTDQVF
jgi:hypothetical protein